MSLPDLCFTRMSLADVLRLDWGRGRSKVSMEVMRPFQHCR